ncbi:MAG: hypothetical protein AVDCRST_MAG41-4442, partial [uncultured Corynebacteriales bacterium]
GFRAFRTCRFDDRPGSRSGCPRAPPGRSPAGRERQPAGHPDRRPGPLRPARLREHHHPRDRPGRQRRPGAGAPLLPVQAGRLRRRGRGGVRAGRARTGRARARSGRDGRAAGPGVPHPVGGGRAGQPAAGGHPLGDVVPGVGPDPARADRRGRARHADRRPRAAPARAAGRPGRQRAGRHRDHAVRHRAAAAGPAARRRGDRGRGAGRPALPDRRAAAGRAGRRRL